MDKGSSKGVQWDLRPMSRHLVPRRAMSIDSRCMITPLGHTHCARSDGGGATSERRREASIVASFYWERAVLDGAMLAMAANWCCRQSSAAGGSGPGSK
jgi:hypothetical protein